MSVFFVCTMKDNGDQNQFVTNRLQNTFVYVPQKKGLKHESE